MTKAASARGLFRATGKKPKRDLITGEYSRSEDGLEREKDDFYPTPAEPTRAGLAAEIQRLRDFPVIWEPACGDGAMVREMETLGLRVARSDLVDRACPGAMLSSFYDFTESSALSKAIFTNPPFDQCGWGNGKARWLYHAIETLAVDYMALLLPWSWPGAGGLAAFWSAHPPSRVYLMRWKIDFTGQGAPPNLNAWFVWDKASPVPAGGDPPLKMLDRIDARQGAFDLEAA